MAYLIVSDIDHTLLNSSGELLDVNVSALADAQAAGATVVLATARSYAGARLVYDLLDLNTPLVVSNGTLVMSARGELLMAQTLGKQTARDIVPLFKESPHHWSFRTTSRAYVHPEFDVSLPPFNDPAHYMPTETHVLEDVLGEHSDIISATLYGQNLHTYQHDARWQAFNVTTDYYPASAFSKYEAFSVMSKTASKGNAVAWLRNQLGLASAVTVCIGDSVADATMFPLGIGVAPENALDVVKLQADWVAPHCDDGAVAAAIERFIL